MPVPELIRSPDSPSLEALRLELAKRADDSDADGSWPAEQLALCREAGVFEWFVPEAWGGQGWGDLDLLRAFSALAGGCLATTFILTQPAGAARRLADCENESLQQIALPAIAQGDRLASVGISHLTTSRQHFANPVLEAEEVEEGYLLDGAIPWVTGAAHAEWIVTGATLADGRQLLGLLPTATKGVTTGPPARLVGLTSTHTAEVRCKRALLPRDCLMAGPIEHVLAQGGAGTGGLQTSALALGLARAAIEYLAQEASRRPDLCAAAESLAAEHAELWSLLEGAARDEPRCTPDSLRSRSNSLVLRSTQAALTAAKGSGYVVGHPAGRWCREAMFFLVWSCPQPVASAVLCELAGIG